MDLFDRAGEAADALLSVIREPPPIAIILGSGMGSIADRLTDRVVIPYERIPHFPIPTVAGHQGNLVVGSFGEARLLVLQGRFHSYEGHDLDDVTFPVRVLQRLGVRTLILTAATGGILASLRPGTIVCVSDHLNLIGGNPLRGANDARLGTRFPDLSEIYPIRLREAAQEEAARLGLCLPEVVYAGLPGPTYETPAEVRMLRALGADVVGMSTVPEAIVARHAGIDVLALALVTNAAAGVSSTPISHEEVLESARQATPILGALIEEIVKKIHHKDTKAQRKTIF